MSAPRRIWLQLGNEPTTYEETVRGGWHVTWCEDQQDPYDIPYILIDSLPIERIRQRLEFILVAADEEGWRKEIEHQNALLHDILKAIEVEE